MPRTNHDVQMRVQLTDGSTQFRQVTINVTQPAAPPAHRFAPPPPPVDPLAGTRWKVVKLNDGMGAVTTTIADTSITLAFDASGQATGGTRCDTYSRGLPGRRQHAHR